MTKNNIQDSSPEGRLTPDMLRVSPQGQLSKDPNAVAAHKSSRFIDTMFGTPGFNPQVTQGQSNQMHPNKAMASLAFATHLVNQMLEHHKSPSEDQTSIQNSQNPEPTQEQPTQESPQEKTSNEEKNTTDTSGVEKLISDLQATHDKEITQLRSEISTGKMKAEYQTKIDELEKTHKQEITNLQNEIKQILKS